MSDKSINKWTGEDVEDDRPELSINHPHLDKITILTFKQGFGWHLNQKRDMELLLAKQETFSRITEHEIYGTSIVVDH